MLIVVRVNEFDGLFSDFGVLIDNFWERTGLAWLLQDIAGIGRAKYFYKTETFQNP